MDNTKNALAATEAGLAFAVIDAELTLIGTGLAVGIGEIAEGSSAAIEGAAKNGGHGNGQPFKLGSRQLVRGLAGINARIP